MWTRFTIPALLLLCMAVYAVAFFAVLDRLKPLSIPGQNAAAKDFAVTVAADDGSPLRAFPDGNGVWRYPVTPDEVSPLYLSALLNYEDRYFWVHPGVNPFALARALCQFIIAGRPLSGGSTLTMQVARIFHPHARTVAGKIYQMFRALQLERHFSKREILTLYLNYAPFGGAVEGVQAASYTYLDKPAGSLSHAEAALLAVLPQSPTRMRPDRHPDRAAAGRNKVIDRVVKFGVWDARTAAAAKMERVLSRYEPRPMMAPLLARRLKPLADPFRPVMTFIDPAVQGRVEDLVAGFMVDAPERTSAAVLVVENDTLAVRAYAGSADFLDVERFGHVDMVRAIRSPGSTLKPFLYAVALEEGLIHSESLLVDAPIGFSGYRPDNFTGHFSGPVSASEALKRSLNLPAVDLLDRLGPAFFDARLRQGGIRLGYPPQGGPNLSLILGGAGTCLEDLVGAFRALARGGLAGRPRMTRDQPLKERRFLDPGAAYVIRRILEETPRPDLPAGRLSLARSRQVAWKTGTSFGFRDAWTIGVTDRHTIGVWVGRPDGTPSPGRHGRSAAAPLLFRIVDSLPRRDARPEAVPENVGRREICWPLGTAPSGENEALCHLRRTAWVLDGMVPPTLPDRSEAHWQANPARIWIDPATGMRVAAGCTVPGMVPETVARWPRAAEPWLSPRLRRMSALPPLSPGCRQTAPIMPETIRIIGIDPGTIFRPPGSQARLPAITLEAQGGIGGLCWLLNGELVARCGIGEIRYCQLRRPGRFHLTVMDQEGNYDAVAFDVSKGFTGG